MGTSCISVRGRWVLDCADCGRGGGVLRRRCPVGYCPAAQLCGPCYAAERADGRWAEHHRECPRYHARYIAEERARAAEPEMWARAAWSDSPFHGANAAPTGMVRVLTHAGTIHIIPEDRYQPAVRGFGTL